MIFGNRVRAGKVQMLAIDVAQLVFSLGLFGVVCRQGETMLEDTESMLMIGITSGFIGVCWEVGWGVMDKMLSSNSAGKQLGLFSIA